ncbi:uncharacterized protein B0T23DRAFT_408131 [Neurospora hispaniola]|uniref:N-acetyltransferase domain-containing protein n=1 Tax=Neurospora hispaniola TaxID=588809 RepID=A0AAJ0MMG5_9PEZI|nr:hypothetical protein B0T23DRAFT_408131 [Neurospora hispaniola]
MPLDPQWDYRFPLRKEFPEDHYKYTRMLFKYFLDPSFDDWTVMVIEDVDPAGSEKLKIASISRGGSTRRDANQQHFNAFHNGQAKAYKKYFGDIGPEQLHLQILATLPDFQRRGHATTLCRWGMDVIRRESLKDISVMASPMGYHLYTRLGFDHLATVIIQVLGEDEKLTLQAMKIIHPLSLSTLIGAMEHGWNYILLFVFSLILILANAASVHSANTRRQLVAAIEPNTVLVEPHDQGHLAPAMPFLEPFTATTAPATTATTATETNKIEAVYLPPSTFPPEASCMMAIWSLIVDIPTPGPALSAALHQAKDTLAPSAMASPQCTITLPATLSSEYGVYTSRVSSWVSKHSKELDTLDSVCAETSRDTGTGPGCTAPVAVFTGETSVGTISTGATSTSATSTGASSIGATSTVTTSTGSTSTGTSTAAGGGKSSTSKATGSSAGVMTSTKMGTGMTTTTTTVATVTSSVTSSLTGSATTVAGVTSSQSVSGPQQAGSAARMTGVVAAAMVVAGFLAVVVAL